MKRLLMVIVAAVVLAAPSFAQSQNDNSDSSKDISLPEFRQVLVDLGAYIDGIKGTDFARQFQAIDDEMLMKLYPAVPDARRFQTLVAKLKQQKFSGHSRSQSRSSLTAGPLVVTPACGAPTSIIENGGACTPVTRTRPMAHGNLWWAL
jgi:hypothetical protein